MANEEQLAILKQGVDVWNKWRNDNYLVEVDLSGVDLIGANLQNVDLHGTNLSRANLKQANLVEAKLTTVNLKEANLKMTNLLYAHLNADLTGADLSYANLTGTYLWGSYLGGAKIGGTSFGNTDLSHTNGLEKVRHGLPSIIGAETIRLSRGKIPEAFLRGCGLSDMDIEYAKLSDPDLGNEQINMILYKIYELRATQALQISPLFISYSHGDALFVERLERYLNKKGVRFWRDVRDATSGRLEKQIDRAMHLNPTVLLILSEHSLQSDWVEHEVRTARALEKEMKRDVLCPVALDNSWKNSPWSKRIMGQVMEYNILDFSAWKDEAKFENTFNKLIDGLELFYK